MAGSRCAELLGQIHSANQIDELKLLRRQADEQLKALLPSHPAEQLIEQLNEWYDALIARTIVLAEAEMEQAGNGYPPVPYAYVLFGSGGREEQVFLSDQDSGLIYHDLDRDATAANAYFCALGKLIVQRLQHIGFPPCAGNVLSGNPEWCLPLAAWGKKLERWFDEATWEAVRYLLIVADGRCVYGDASLFHSFKQFFNADMVNRPLILRRMTENTMRHKVLVGIFGQLIKEPYGQYAGGLDIKYGAYIPMVNGIRLLSIQSAIRVQPTLKRIKALVALGKLSAQEGERYERAFRCFLRLRLMTAGREVEGGGREDAKLSSGQLTKTLASELKSSLKQGRRLQRAILKQYSGKREFGGDD